MPEQAKGASSQIPEAMWNEFVPTIKVAIEREYNLLDDKSLDERGQNTDWMRAFLVYTNGIAKAQDRRLSWWRANITGLMVITAIMALAFGGLGAWGLTATGAAKDATAGFLDIAKLFAGTLVGAAGATAASRR